MLSKLSSVLFNYSFRYNTKTIKSIINCTNFRGFNRSFHTNKYDLQKFTPPKSNNKSQKTREDLSAQSIMYYTLSVVVLCGGLTFAAVPLYRLFCQVDIKHLHTSNKT